MAELANCPRCNALYVKNLKGICDACRKEEDKLFEEVYQYIRKKENRTASVPEISEATGVSQDLIMKFVKEGRLRTALFPNIGYECERCGKLIQKGKICASCTNEMKKELARYQREEEREKERKAHTYYAMDEKYGRKD